jgi:predicted SprT family Zn-dependent metalloprotease
MMSIQLLEKGEFQETKLKFNPDIAAENQRKYAVAVVAHERYVCF